jgi:hypothetical protein
MANDIGLSGTMRESHFLLVLTVAGSVNCPGTKDVRQKLQSAITAYSNSDQMPATGTRKRRPQNVANKRTSASKATPDRPMEYVNASTAAASVRTSSTISSLSQNSISSPVATRVLPMAPTRTTRRSQSLESSSDDGDGLDEEDNMYVDNVLSDLDDLQDNSDDDEDNNTVVAGTSQKDSEGLAQFLENIHWNFCAEVALLDEEPPLPYNGPTGLKPRVAESFDDPFQCLAICGGLDYDLVCRLARNSNEYVRHHLLPKDRNNRLHGKAYANITAEEMYHFLGITLRISLSPVDYGGYEAYFSAQDRKILNKHIFSSDGFARHFMTLSRYKQIRTAFHPEDQTGGMEGDKCYQLRHAINTILTKLHLMRSTLGKMLLSMKEVLAADTV